LISSVLSQIPLSASTFGFLSKAARRFGFSGTGGAL